MKLGGGVVGTYSSTPVASDHGVLHGLRPAQWVLVYVFNSISRSLSELHDMWDFKAGQQIYNSHKESELHPLNILNILVSIRLKKFKLD